MFLETLSHRTRRVEGSFHSSLLKRKYPKGYHKCGSLSVKVFLVVSRIIGRVTLTVGGRSVDVEALFDTGATRSFVDVGVAEKLSYTRFDKPREVLLAIGDSKAYFVEELVARVTIEGFELPLSHVFGVISGLRYPAVIGMVLWSPMG
jgi:predicted aspartyl protease